MWNLGEDYRVPTTTSGESVYITPAKDVSFNFDPKWLLIGIVGFVVVMNVMKGR